jgi:hypothetical protein
LNVWPSRMPPTPFRLINHADARLFTAMANGCKWNSDDFAMK